MNKVLYAKAKEYADTNTKGSKLELKCLAEMLYEFADSQIADIKANCDYVLEGKENEYREERSKLIDDFENMKAGLESQIATLGERCNQLLKDKGDLTDRCRELETRCNELFLQTNEQAEQIKKMKCPWNCKKFSDCKLSNCPCDKWEIKENE